MVFSGFLTDGRIAERRATQVVLGASQLRFFDTQGRLTDEWSYAGLQRVDVVYGSQPVRLSHLDRHSACLTIEDPKFLPLFMLAVPQVCEQGRVRRRTLMSLSCLGMALVFTVLGMLWWVPRLANDLVRVVPRQWEERIGQRIAATFVRQAPVCNGATGQAALQGLTDRLAATMLTPFPFRVQVYKSPMVNAFAMPGGQIVVFSGLISGAQSPEEVAGVLAHEMGHQMQHHPMRGLIRSLGLRMVSAAMLGGFSATAASGAHAGEVLFSLSYSREDEAEADRIGAGMLTRANIRGDGLIDFFTRYQGSEESKLASRRETYSVQNQLMAFLSTHPPGHERIAHIRPLLLGKQGALTATQWKAVQAICEEN